MKRPTHRILVIIVKWVGEILISTPVIRALSKSYPNSEITVAVDKEYEDVLSGNPYVARLFLLDPNDSPVSLVRKSFVLRKMRFNITIDLLATPRSALISLLSGATIRFGLDKRVRRLAYNRFVPSSGHPTPYMADRRLNVLRALHKPTDGTQLDFFIDDKSISNGKRILAAHGIRPGDRFITISPVSLREWKLWPFEEYAKVADYLVHEKHQKVVLLCGPGEYHFLEKVMDCMEFPPSAAIEFSRLEPLGYVLKQAVLHIGNDGGIQHLASAVGVKTITIFGPADADAWNEYKDPRHIALQKEISCRQWRCHRDCPYEYECLRLVESQDVVQSIDLMLE